MSKRQEIRDKRKRQSTINRIVLISLVSVGALLIAYALIAPTLQPVGEVIAAESLPRPQADFNAMGDPNAPITITEYSDFQCPFCQRFYLQTEKQLTETYVAGGQVRFVYRSFGYFIGEESGRSAEAAYCAGDQGKFWEMHDTIFVNWSGENQGAFSDRRLAAFAESIGLDMAAFSDCFDSGKYNDRVVQDQLDGRAANIRATPSFTLTYTNSRGELITRLIEGAQPFEYFQQEIEAALADIGQ